MEVLGGRTFKGTVQLNPVLADEVTVVFAEPELSVLSQVLWIKVFRGLGRRGFGRAIGDIIPLGTRSIMTQSTHCLDQGVACPVDPRLDLTFGEPVYGKKNLPGGVMVDDALPHCRNVSTTLGHLW